MASLKELKGRINSVKSTQKITKAMKMVAAAKLRRAQAAAEAGAPLCRAPGSGHGQPRRQGDGRRQRAQAAGRHRQRTRSTCWSSPPPTRGLCRRVQHQHRPAARAQGRTSCIAEGKTVKFYLVGRKGRAVDPPRLPRARSSHQFDTSDSASSVGFADAAGDRRRDLIALLRRRRVRRRAPVLLAASSRRWSQEPTEQQIIPVAAARGGARRRRCSAAVEYEPDEEEILADLLPRNLTIQIFRALLENAASEQGAAMTAMDNATRNAGDMINKLTIQYNRTRQAAITTELIEIISGAEAL